MFVKDAALAQAKVNKKQLQAERRKREKVAAETLEAVDTEELEDVYEKSERPLTLPASH